MIIRSVEGPAKKAGLLAGEKLLSLNGHPIGDVLDYNFYSYESRLTVTVEAPDGQIRSLSLRHREGEDPGLTFDDYLMDSQRHCQNACVFCFIDQNPPGARESLYFKDDDARLGFLLGNYITLTNLDEAEIQRICRFRLSPLGISVHATDPEVRFSLLRNPKARQGFLIMQRFAKHGIAMNAQIVLCPGYNDGQVLDDTLRDLHSLGDALISVSIVPVGLTKHRQGLLPLEPLSREQAACVVRDTAVWPKAFCSDELYLRAGLPLPPASFYGDFPQLENGVGMQSLFADEWEQYPALTAAEPSGDSCAQPESCILSLATGLAAEPFFRRLLRGLPVAVHGVENHFFGDTVDVAGLLTGGDLLRDLRQKPLGKALLIPSAMLRHGTDVFLDDMTLPTLSAALQTKIIPLEPSADALYEALEDLLGDSKG